jgi:hypothetical protein
LKMLKIMRKKEISKTSENGNNNKIDCYMVIDTISPKFKENDSCIVVFF